MKNVVGYEGFYKITPDGQVYSIRSNKFLKLNYKKNGYVYIELNLDGVAKTFRVHRLVAEAYIPNPDNKPTVNHINCIKSDNRVENLEWATISENTKHAYDMNLIVSPNISEYIITDKKEEVRANNYAELRDLTGYGFSQLSSYINNKHNIKRGRYKGYKILKIS